ncbi:Na+/Ca+ antiporter, CaCa family [Formosa agariphila KMM 3901]|uniref:Na+/Ca+ antiporter, CaCa family n=1 Tax=Formosa agariphila (strain DSM 15362 / KCTC 12365 / LMG 23005 / KMM 3901 / M-2Alg 35-1) TaxID=1347342 RepID=T2KLJ8_FORAG|nr:calcium/sodium antiporter [Formosa agariphila]CDF79308.1 Na+/Ca+ antiporter, CaCa family [Formosa agariphila KMM 3901]
MILSSVFIIVGFASLIFGANWLVDGATSLAKKHHISDLVIGLTIVAFGTSAPELVVNTVASFHGHSDIVFGNIIGSNNFNLFIILGIAGLIYPITVQSSTAWREIPISLLVALLLFVLANDFFSHQLPEISRVDGVLLLVVFICFLYSIFKQLKQDPIEAISYENKSNFKIWSLVILGIAGLIIGGKLVVDHSIDIATKLGVSQKIIGLTIIAAGTSLPELVTSVVAALKKNSDIAIGNVIGSNIFNVLLILSISAFVHPITYNPNFNQDLFILIGGTVFLILAMFTGTRKKLDRWEAFILLSFYVIYTSYLVMKEI